ncbi:uncharacterized protein LACBIDRAFT_329293 [Laccaria bicolor S238N-H82]|uniref:Predicted protein n=1 Tax=Laccaria bicolor (strain S238N-H82 / ATCC MYA-4686) TaxID=486041 RepID=B0DHK6_LACBS|nr:uncharacterized protein LACBIDRAFT_329293 [Laccaria bicolor S238N-H82]EDR05853.1 predicted protein [Laccaria bicolor S238N-H82]|eukprot:XP_001883529.1 predicted protein [Laccaria bicolor S238N-H82]
MPEDMDAKETDAIPVAESADIFTLIQIFFPQGWSHSFEIRILSRHGTMALVSWVQLVTGRHRQVESQRLNNDDHLAWTAVEALKVSNPTPEAVVQPVAANKSKEGESDTVALEDRGFGIVTMKGVCSELSSAIDKFIQLESENQKFKTFRQWQRRYCWTWRTGIRIN